MVDPSELSRVIAFFDRVRPDAAKVVVRRWRLNPAYVDAVQKIAPPDIAPQKSTVNAKR